MAPSVAVPYHVVMPAQRNQLVLVCRTSVGDTDPVIEITPSCRAPTTREHTTPVAGLDLTPERRVRSAAGDPGMDDGAGLVRDGESPRRPSPTGNLAGQVGHDRAEATLVGSAPVEIHERGEVDSDVDDAPRAFHPAFEQIQEHVGAQLVDGALFACAAQALRDPGEAVHDGNHTVGR